MSQSIMTPYGQFKAFTAACNHIMQTDAVAFIIQYPNYKYPYTAAAKKYAGNNSAQHYVYMVIKHLCDDPKVVDWYRI